LDEGRLLHQGDPSVPYSDDVGLGYLPDCERSLAGVMLLTT